MQSDLWAHHTTARKTPGLVTQSHQFPEGEGLIWAAQAHKLSSWGLNRCIQDALGMCFRLLVHDGILGEKWAVWLG